MHRFALVAPRSWWVGSCLQAVVCVCGIVLGASLVGLFCPQPKMVAGANGQSVGESVLLDFTASWCQPCQRMNPIIASLERQGYPIRRVDVDRERAVAERYGIKTIPTFVLVVNGQEVMRQTGETSEGQLRRMLLQIPDWQRELSRREQSRLREAKTASASRETESVATPFVELNEPALQPAPEEDRPRFTFPLLENSVASPTEAKDGRTWGEPLARGREPVVRGQSRDHEAVASPRPADPLRVSTRLRVKDQGSVNFGSGTVIESRVGRSIILTCGHLFRDLSPRAVVEVDVFEHGQKPETYLGKVVDFDLAADVGLVAIPTLRSLPAARLGTLERAAAIGDNVVSIGCGGGETPTRETVQITAINKYDGPDNVECTGMPIPGRSGGGLFRGNELIGICIAADPKEQRGLYCGLRPVHELLQRAGLAHLLPGQPGETASAAIAGAKAEGTPLPAKAVDPAANGTASPSLAAIPAHVPSLDTAPAVTEVRASEGLSPAQGRERGLTGLPAWPADAEVICIVRPKNSSAPSRVVIIHQATPKLLSYLQDASGPATNVATGGDRPGDTLIPTSGSAVAEPNRGAFSDVAIAEPAATAEKTPRRPPSPRAR